MGIRLTGTLGVLLDAKRSGLVSAVAPLLDQLQNLRFRLAPNTRDAVLKLAGETP
jgi:predicted nucleic acid-binding protein